MVLNKFAEFKSFFSIQNKKLKKSELIDLFSVMFYSNTASNSKS